MYRKRAYEEGQRDGLANIPKMNYYHDKSDWQEYEDGYQSGILLRDELVETKEKVLN